MNIIFDRQGNGRYFVLVNGLRRGTISVSAKGKHFILELDKIFWRDNEPNLIGGSIGIGFNRLTTAKAKAEQTLRWYAEQPKPDSLEAGIKQVSRYQTSDGSVFEHIEDARAREAQCRFNSWYKDLDDQLECDACGNMVSADVLRDFLSLHWETIKKYIG